MYNLVSHLVYSAIEADVREVIIDGKPVTESRKLLTLDQEEILAKAGEWGRKIQPISDFRFRIAD